MHLADIWLSFSELVTKTTAVVAQGVADQTSWPKIIAAAGESPWGVLALFLLVVLGFAVAAYPAVQGDRGRLAIFVIVSFLLGGALYVIFAGAVPTGRAYVREVRGNVQWTDTNVDVSVGKSLRVEVVGTIQYTLRSSAPGNGFCGPTGVPAESRDDNDFSGYNLREQSNHAAVLGKIGEGGEPFHVGDVYYEPAMAEAGGLFLGINDRDFGNNRGSFAAIITIP